MLDDPDYCKMIDCTKSKSATHCPITCNETTEPVWCEFADCSDPKAMEKCKNTCRYKGIHFNEYILGTLLVIFFNKYFQKSFGLSSSLFLFQVDILIKDLDGSLDILGNLVTLLARNAIWQITQ